MVETSTPLPPTSRTKSPRIEKLATTGRGGDWARAGEAKSETAKKFNNKYNRGAPFSHLWEKVAPRSGVG